MYLNTLKNIAISSLCRGVSWDLGALGCFFVPQDIGIFNQRENQCPRTHWVLFMHLRAALCQWTGLLHEKWLLKNLHI